jgi:hypothetical protein
MWTARKWEMIPDINRDYPITFRLTQGFSGEQELCLPVSRFQVTDGDRTAYYWTDKRGRKRKKVMPPYFISNMRVARNNIRQFLDSTRGSYVVSLLEGSNPLVRRAFAMAMSHAAGGKSPLVSEALDTWVAARLIESHWRVSSGYSMSDVGPIASEEGHPYRNFNPITPMMDSQFDDLVIREFLSPQRDRILQRLKKMFYDDRRRSNWLEIHLTILIMMSNTGWILKDMMNMMDWKGLKVCTWLFPALHGALKCWLCPQVSFILTSRRSLARAAVNSPKGTCTRAEPSWRTTTTRMVDRSRFRWTLNHFLLTTPSSATCQQTNESTCGG